MFQKSPGFVTENSPMVGLHQEAWQRLTGLAPGYSQVSFQLEDKQLWHDGAGENLGDDRYALYLDHGNGCTVVYLSNITELYTRKR